MDVSTTTQPWTTHDSNVALYHCLISAAPNRPALPAELILQILMLPSRWLLLYRKRYPSRGPKTATLLSVRESKVPILSTRPFSAREAPLLRMAVFTFYSRDQGWSDYPEHHGTTINSYSWFEAGLTPNIVPIKSLEQRERRVEKEHKRYELQRNLHAEKKVQKHIKTIDQGHELLSCVEEGDRITVWACAAFPEWVNRVSGASIELLFLDDLNETMEAKMELEEDW